MSDLDLTKIFGEDKPIKNTNKNKDKNKNHPILKGLKVQKLESLSTDFKQRPYMVNKVVPHFPSSCVFVGGSGSGKTTALMNLFLNQDIYRGYFDEIYLFSKTGKSDDMATYLQLPNGRIITENLEEELKKLVDKLKKEAENLGPQKMKKRCIIFEDLTANRKLLNSPSFDLCFVQARHLATSVFACVHKYKALTRLARLQAMYLVVFECPLSDRLQIIEDWIAPRLNKQKFIDLFNFVYKKENKNDRNFLVINNQVDVNDRYRKNWDKIIKY